MRFANGTKLLGALPIRRANVVEEWVVLVERDPSYEEDRWVTARMGSLDDTSWYWGNYFGDYVPAEADLYLRAWEITGAHMAPTVSEHDVRR